MSNFHSRKGVGHGSEAQFYVDKYLANLAGIGLTTLN